MARKPDFAEMTATQIRAHRETVFLRLLNSAAQRETVELVTRLAAAGYDDVQMSYVPLLANVDTEGTRIITISQRTGNTRQAVSQLVSEIEARGYVERVPDPNDGRAVLVRHTARGRALLARALGEMSDIEARYARALGRTRFESLKQLLHDLERAEQPGGSFGR